MLLPPSRSASNQLLETPPPPLPPPTSLPNARLWIQLTDWYASHWQQQNNMVMQMVTKINMSHPPPPPPLDLRHGELVEKCTIHTQGWFLFHQRRWVGGCGGSGRGGRGFKLHRLLIWCLFFQQNVSPEWGSLLSAARGPNRPARLHASPQKRSPTS